MAEREVTIVIRGKNLTKAEFDAARKELAGVGDQAKKTSESTMTLGNVFKAAGAAAAALGIGNAIKDFADFTGQLTDLSAKTGIGVEALQRLKYAAEQNGGTLDQVTGAITKLGANLVGGNESAVGALKALGLSFDDVRKMAPDEAFTSIADAIAKVPDPMAQSKLAMDLFGKSGAELLPMMKGNLSETAAAADRLGIVLSEDAVRAGDEFGDTMGTLAAVGKSVIAQVLEPMIPVMTTVAQWLGEKLPGAVRFIVDALSTGFARAWIDAKILFHQFVLGIAEGVNKIPLLGDAIGFSASTIDGLRANVQHAKDQLAGFTQQTIAGAAAQETSAKTIASLNLNYAANEKASTKAASALQKAHKHLADWNDEVDKTNASIARSMSTHADFTTAIEVHTERVAKSIIANALAKRDAERQLEAVTRGQTMTRLQLEIDAVNRWASNEKLKLDQTVAGWEAAAAEIDKVASRKIAILDEDDLLQQRIVFNNLETDAKKAASNIGAAFKDIGNVIIGAIQGGGSVLQAVGSSLGTALGKDLAEDLGESFSLFGSKALGGAFTAMLPGLGALVGPLIGKIAGLFTSKNTAEVRRYNEEIGKVRDTLLDQHGTLEQIEARARAVGLSFQNEWGHQGKAGLEAFNTLAKEFNKRWDELNERLASSRAELAGVIERARELGYEFDQSGAFIGVTFDALRTKAQEFGVDLNSLGPAIRQQALDEEAKKVIDAFTLMEKAAGPAGVGGILVGMRDEIGKIVSDSLEFGTTIPGNMEPWIRELHRTGQLTDENGRAINDLSQLEFGEPVATEFEKITTKIEELITAIGTMVEKINTTLTPAIDNVTRDRTIHVGFQVDNPPDIDFGGREPGFARGTYGMTGVDFPDFGDGTRVVVHNREAIVPYEDRVSTATRWLQQAGAGMAAAASIAVAAPNVYIVNDFTGARQVSEAEYKQIQRRLNSGELQVPGRAVVQRGR